jgi:hypothetical protein
VLCKHEVVGSIPSGSTRREGPGEGFVHDSFAVGSPIRGLFRHREEETYSDAAQSNLSQRASPACGRRKTATLPDMFEAILVFSIDFRAGFAWRIHDASAEGRHGVDIDNESNQAT